MITAIIGLLLPIGGAWLALRALRLRTAADSALVTVAVAIGVGLAVSSVVTFWCAVLGISIGSRFAVVDALVWSSIGVTALWAGRAGRAGRRSPADSPNEEAQASSPSRLTVVDWLLRAAYVVVAAIALGTVVAHYRVSPHGEWDAWAIWNQKARFLVRDDTQWTGMFSTRGMIGGHPLLVPLSVARLWAYAGSETTLVPAMLGILWGAGIVAAVVGAFGTHDRRAWLAGSVVMAPAVFPQLMAVQTADLAIGFFAVATLAMLRSAAASADPRDAWRSLLLTGVLASAAAWTKNEGLILIAATTLVLAWVTLRRRAVFTTSWFAAGAVPISATVLYFKVVLAPLLPGYMSEAQTPADILARLVDPARHALVSGLVYRHWMAWGGPLATGILPLMMAAAVVAACRRAGRSERPLLAVGVMMLAAYYTVWVFSPSPTEWLVRITFDRLLMQLWPTLVVAAFCWVAGDTPSPEAAAVAVPGDPRG